VAYSTFPIEDPAGMNFAQWQSMSAAQVPDAVVFGLNVTFVGNVVRMSAGKANLGGCTFVNSASVDVGTIAGNSSGQTRTDRVILRLTFTPNSTPAGAAVDIQPVIVSGTGIDGPALTQNMAGTYEIPLARWAVANGGNQPFGGIFYNDGPGPGACGWALDAVKTPNNTITGFDGLATAVRTASGDGPNPASISGQNLRITLPGRYTVTYKVLLMNAATLPVPGALPWISLGLLDDIAYSGFSLALDTASANGRARIEETFSLSAGQVPFEVQPHIYQATGGPQDTYLRLRIVRHR
jgi:hypothetical protein